MYRRATLQLLVLSAATMAFSVPPSVLKPLTLRRMPCLFVGDQRTSTMMPSKISEDNASPVDFCEVTTRRKNAPQTHKKPVDLSRRRALQTIAATTAAATCAPESALAGKPEYDKFTGELYTPKAEMLAGGSAAARGTGLTATSSSSRLKPGQALQTVYETRFITYLSRFLLTFDPAANAWWVQNVGTTDTWDLGSGGSNTFRQGLTRDEVDAKFAEFSESVELGLAGTYFYNCG